jgi:hypothetical protein
VGPPMELLVAGPTISWLCSAGSFLEWRKVDNSLVDHEGLENSPMEENLKSEQPTTYGNR